MRTKEGFRCDASQEADNYRVDGVDLPPEMGSDTRFIFDPARNAVTGRSALDHTGDEKIIAFQAGQYQDLIENFSRTPDKWPALDIFLPARCFSHEHNFRVFGALTRNGPLALPVEMTPRTVANFPGNSPEFHRFPYVISPYDEEGLIPLCAII